MINHGGSNSVYEAIYHGVPIVSIPINGDRFDVTIRVEVREFAKQVNITTLMGENLLQVVVDVLGNRRWVNLFKPQPFRERSTGMYASESYI